jgi:membrane-bound metal-dependent hydrolase YbcI (DUF457 family)
MALLKEHFEFGLIAGGILYIILFAIASYFHLFGSFYIWLISFIVGFVAMVAGSMLPDLDAPRSPVHDNLLVFVGILIAMVIQGFGPTTLAVLLAPPLSVYLDRNHLPSHRGFVHTIGAAILFGMILAGSLYFFLTKIIVFCLWCGFSSALGHLLHLTKDGQIRL